MGLNISLETNGETIRILVEGEVDLYTSPKLRSAIMESVPASSSRVEVDLSAVDYMDSSGVATLVEGFKSSREHKKSFTLVTPSLSVMKVLELAKLDSVFEIQKES